MVLASERGRVWVGVVGRSGDGDNGAPADRTAQGCGDFVAVVLDARGVEASKGSLQCRSMHPIRGAMVMILLGELGRHFLPREAVSIARKHCPDCDGKRRPDGPEQLAPSPATHLLRRLIYKAAGHGVLQRFPTSKWTMRCG